MKCNNMKETSMLRDQIYNDVRTAMKNQDAEKLETLRFVWAEIKNAEIDAKHELSDEEVTKLLRTEVKRRKDAIEQFQKGGRKDLAEAEKDKLQIIEGYLPELMSREDIEKVTDEVIANGANDFGVVMGQVMGKVKGKADGKVVVEVVKDKLR